MERPSNKVTWSYSSLTDFENCARKYQKTRVTKEIVDLGSEATRWGTEVHKALELRIKDGTPLPEGMAHYEPMMQVIAKTKGKVYTEYEMALDIHLSPVPFDSEDRWVRGIADIVVINGSRGFVGDYKTGKVRPDSKQLALMAGMLFVHFPELESCVTAFMWMKYGKTTKEIYKREDCTHIWGEFMPRVVRLEHAYDKDAWLPNPSGLCGYCPCTLKHCEFAKKRT